MADFRKWFFAFAVLALMLGASTAYAQLPGPSSVTCNATPANPHTIRVEGITEQAGDVVLVCTGGTPTPVGQLIPQVDISLTVNTNITSRLLGGGFIDTLLVVDEAFPSASPFPATPTNLRVTGSPGTQKVCYSQGSGSSVLSIPSGCNSFPGTFNLSGPNQGNFSGNPYEPTTNPNAYNVFVAKATASPSQVVWLGVPIDAPGTAGSRVLRMTNIYVNACQIGLSSTLVPSQISAFISIQGSSNIVINGTGQQVIAFVQQGLIVSNVNSTLVQCNNLNTGLGIGLNVNGVPASLVAVTSARVTEGFASAFKRQIAANGVVPDAFTTVNASIAAQLAGTSSAQNVPGFNYNSETGFQPPQPAGGAAVPFGFANQGTRFLLRFNNVGTGVRIFLPIDVALTIDLANPATPVPASNPSGWTGGFLQLVGSVTDTSGNVTGVAPSATATFTNSALFFTSPPFKGGVGVAGNFGAAVELPVTNGVATALYEVANADPAIAEIGNIPIGVAYTSNTANNIPTPGATTLNVSFAPLSTVNVASSTAPIPRFCDRSTANTVWTINVCTCNLLFPFVTQQGGFDTGVAIANTSLDPYGTSPQNGIVTLNYYGNTTGGGAAPAAQSSTVVKGGEELTFTLSSGGDHGVAATPGFQGYIIAIAKFQFCHGFAFISDLGAQKLAEGYLAIQLDIYGGTGLNRTGVVGEVQGH